MITTEEAEQWAKACEHIQVQGCATALRSLAAERDALLKEREYEREAYDHNLDLRDKVIDARVSQLKKAEAERDALKAERDILKRDNEIMVGMINDMGTIFIKARAALGEK